MDVRLHIVVPLECVHSIDEAVLVRRKRTGRAVSRNATINEFLVEAIEAEKKRQSADILKEDQRG